MSELLARARVVEHTVLGENVRLRAVLMKECMPTRPVCKSGVYWGGFTKELVERQQEDAMPDSVR